MRGGNMQCGGDIHRPARRRAGPPGRPPARRAAGRPRKVRTKTRRGVQLSSRAADVGPMPARHVPVMERLAIPALSSSPDRDLLEAIRAWQSDARGMSLLEYTG